MGKIIYQSKGAAAEYSKYAFSAYLGCPVGCHYCFNKKGRFKKTFGSDVPTLKKCFRDEAHALQVFEKELKENLPELQRHGLLLSFTTDPLVQETYKLTSEAVSVCLQNDVPVKLLTKKVVWIEALLLTKKVVWIEAFLDNLVLGNTQPKIAFGFTLTGHDEIEPNASTNAERIEAMRRLHEVGFKTWASIEPIIDFESSKKMIDSCWKFCDLFKVGLESGKKYDSMELMKFLDWSIGSPVFQEENVKFYFKDSLLKQAGIDRADLPKNCVKRDYNIFKNE